MKTSGRYRPGLIAGAGGFLLLITINAIGIPASLQRQSQKDAIQASVDLQETTLKAQAELETARAKAQKKTADAYAENQTLAVKALRISNYVDSPTAPPQFDARMFPDPKQKVWIYDANYKCIGTHQDKKFTWIHFDDSACNQGQN